MAVAIQFLGLNSGAWILAGGILAVIAVIAFVVIRGSREDRQQPPSSSQWD